jgi:hypothetical protein
MSANSESENRFLDVSEAEMVSVTRSPEIEQKSTEQLRALARRLGQAHGRAKDNQVKGCNYSSSWPNSLPVFRLRKCSLVQAGQMIPSYSCSRTSSSSSDQCWTFIDVVGHLKTK